MYKERYSERGKSVLPFFIFLISPFISLPFIIHDVYHRKKGSLFCLALFMGILTYLLLPDWSLDIARYYVGYEGMKSISFDEFLGYLDTRTDYVFYFLFFIFNQIGLKFQVLLFVASTFNFYVYFYLFEFIVGKEIRNNRLYFFNFIFYFLSITILYYLSGTRYVLGCTFFLLSILFFYFKKAKFKGILLFLISLFTHIGILIYLPIFLIIYKVKSKKLMIQVTTFVFIVFAILPIENVLLGVASFLPGFSNKALIYVNEVRDTNWSLKLSYFTTIVVGLLFLMKYYKKLPSSFLNVFLLVLLPVVITIPFGFLVYDRYVMNFKPILTICVIFLLITQYRDRFNLVLFKKILNLAFILYFTYSIYLYRNNISAYFDIQNLFLYNIFNTTYTIKDIFYI